MEESKRIYDGIVGLYEIRPGVALGQAFGAPCAKVNGKIFTCYFKGDMVFKLSGDARDRAMSLEGASLFDPAGSGRQMKEWVRVPAMNSSFWEGFTEASFRYVSEISK